MSCNGEDSIRLPVDVLINEKERRRRHSRQRPRIRPPASRPTLPRTEKSQEKDSEDNRGVTILDITNGYEPI